MKKQHLLLTLITLITHPLEPMKKKSTLLSNITHKQLEKMIHHKEEVTSTLKTAILHNQDAMQPQKTICAQKKKLWSHILSKYTYSFWQDILLEREKREVLKKIDSELPSVFDMINFNELANTEKSRKENNKQHKKLQNLYLIHQLSENQQNYYEEEIYPQNSGALSGNIYCWHYPSTNPAYSIYPHIYVSEKFYSLPINQRISIIAHEDQHSKNFHKLQKKIINSFLKTTISPEIFAHYTEKEADIKACLAGGIAITKWSIEFLETHRKESDQILDNARTHGQRLSHPSARERIDYLNTLQSKQEKEQLGYMYNPFAQLSGLGEWIQK